MKDISKATQFEIKAIEEYTRGTQRKRHTKIKAVVAKDSKLNKYADYSDVILFLIKLFYEEHSLSYATIKII